MNRKGFTLVEILAVIVILAIIIVIAVPKMFSIIDTNKMSALESSAKLVAKNAESNQVMQEGNEDILCDSVAKLDDNYGACYIDFDDGKAVVTIEGRGKLAGYICQGTKDDMFCEEGNMSNYENSCTINSELTQGLEYIDGPYTYRYKQEYDGSSWVNMDHNGWGVTLTNKDSTDDVNYTTCSRINRKPIVSMRSMFENSQASSINLSKLFTKNVLNMAHMFSQLTIPLDFTNFDTHNVKDMSSMFWAYQYQDLDLSNFNTSNVTNMSSMFADSDVTNLDISNFNTSKVTNMSTMFSVCPAVVDISHFDTTNVTNVEGMFDNTGLREGVARTETDALKLNQSISGSNPFKGLDYVDNSSVYASSFISSRTDGTSNYKQFNKSAFIKYPSDTNTYTNDTNTVKEVCTMYKENKYNRPICFKLDEIGLYEIFNLFGADKCQVNLSTGSIKCVDGAYFCGAIMNNGVMCGDSSTEKGIGVTAQGEVVSTW